MVLHNRRYCCEKLRTGFTAAVKIKKRGHMVSVVSRRQGDQGPIHAVCLSMKYSSHC